MHRKPGEIDPRSRFITRSMFSVTNIVRSRKSIDTSDRRGSRPILSTMARKFFILALLAAFVGMACAGTTPEGIEYLNANKLKEGVVETSSGLQYRVLKEG